MKKFLVSFFTILFSISVATAGGALLYYNYSTEQAGRGFDDFPNENLTQNATGPDDTNDFWSRHYASDFAGGSGTESDPYQIETAEQLAFLAKNVNDGETYSGVYFLQTADINLAEFYWEPIGYDTSRYFSGNYDGGGHTISGIFTEGGPSSSYNYRGLFGVVKGTSSNYAVIKNVKIVDSYFEAYSYCGAIAAQISYTEISNCQNEGDVFAVSGGYTGGIVGNISGGSSIIRNCYNGGDVGNSGRYIGGIVGNSGTDSTIEACYNTGEIRSGDSNVGGIVGYNNFGDVINCFNAGNVTNGSGIIGGAYHSGTMANCINIGRVSGSYEGGIISSVYQAEIKNCVNLGEVLGSSCGGIIGQISSCSAVYSYWGGNCGLEFGYGSTDGSTDDGLSRVEDLNATVRNKDWYTNASNWSPYGNDNWDFDTVWAIHPWANLGLPYLQGSVMEEHMSINLDYMWTDEEVRSEIKTTFEGSGTEDDPYLISTPAELAGLAYKVNIDGENFSGVYFRQTADIDMSKYWWDSIGTSANKFSGNFDGGGQIVSGLFTIWDGVTTYNEGEGLFGTIVGTSTSKTTIKNVGIVNSLIRGFIAGGVVGYAGNYSEIKYCFNTSSVNGEYYAAGIVGDLAATNGTGYIHNCYNSGQIKGGSAGGVIGSAYGQFYNLINYGSVSGSNAGGIMQSLSGVSSLYNSVNTGSVTGTSTGGNVQGASPNAGVGSSYFGVNCSSTANTGSYAQGKYLSNLGTVARTEEWYTNSTNWSSSNPWDFDTVWTIDSSENDAFPTFKKMQVRYYSNMGEDEVIVDLQYANSVLVKDVGFEVLGYELVCFNTSKNGNGTSYDFGEVFHIYEDIDLYAQWKPEIYEITLNHTNGTTDSNIYLCYNTGFFLEETCTTQQITAISSKPTRMGYRFEGYFTEENGEGEMIVDESGVIVGSNTFTTTDTEIFAHWIPNVPAYYNEEGDYWYIEYGKMPQEKLTDNAIITLLQEDDPLDDTDGVTLSPNVYFFADFMLSAKIYDGEEYCNYRGNWYKVLPVRWRIATGNNASGYVHNENALAVMEDIVFVGSYSQRSLNLGEGYVSAISDFSSPLYFFNNFTTSERNYLTEFTATSEKFNAQKKETETSTSYAFISSEDEIESVGGQLSANFSDIVKDYLAIAGDGNTYFLRDLGDNLNNIKTYTSGGQLVNQRPTYFLGMKISITVTEYICV